MRLALVASLLVLLALALFSLTREPGVELAPSSPPPLESVDNPEPADLAAPAGVARDHVPSPAIVAPEASPSSAEAPTRLEVRRFKAPKPRQDGTFTLVYHEDWHEVSSVDVGALDPDALYACRAAGLVPYIERGRALFVGLEDAERSVSVEVVLVPPPTEQISDHRFSLSPTGDFPQLDWRSVSGLSPPFEGTRLCQSVAVRVRDSMQLEGLMASARYWAGLSHDSGWSSRVEADLADEGPHALTPTMRFHWSARPTLRVILDGPEASHGGRVAPQELTGRRAMWNSSAVVGGAADVVFGRETEGEFCLHGAGIGWIAGGEAYRVQVSDGVVSPAELRLPVVPVGTATIDFSAAVPRGEVEAPALGRRTAGVFVAKGDRYTATATIGPGGPARCYWVDDRLVVSDIDGPVDARVGFPDHHWLHDLQLEPGDRLQLEVPTHPVAFFEAAHAIVEAWDVSGDPRRRIRLERGFARPLDEVQWWSYDNFNLDGRGFAEPDAWTFRFDPNGRYRLRFSGRGLEDAYVDL